MNFERFNKYFNDLMMKGFIEGINGSEGKDHYRITERGRTLLDVLKKAERILFYDGH